VLVKPFFARRPAVVILLKINCYLRFRPPLVGLLVPKKQKETRHGRLSSVSVNAPSYAHLSSAAERVPNAASGATDFPNAATAIWISAHGVVASPSVYAAAAAA